MLRYLVTTRQRRREVNSLKKIINCLCVVVIFSILFCGCTIKEVFNEISDLKDYNGMVTSYDVHTEEEMREFALYCLEE